MSYTEVEEFGSIISLVEEDTGYIFIQEGDLVIQPKFKGKSLKYETNSFLFLGADNFLDSNNLIFKKKSNNYLYNFEFNDEWEYEKFWGTKKTTILKDTEESFYDYEVYYEQDFDGDQLYGLVYEPLEEYGDIILKKNSISNLYVNDSSSQWSITQSNGGYLKYQNGKYIAVAAEQIGGMNLLVQKHSVSDNLKILYSDSGEWSFKKRTIIFESWNI